MSCIVHPSPDPHVICGYAALSTHSIRTTHTTHSTHSTRPTRPTHPTHSTRSTLVMTFSEGISLKSKDELISHGIDIQMLVARICEAWAVQMFTDGVFNADPHPGNILVRNEDGIGAVPVLLDFGLCKRLSPQVAGG